MTEQPPSDAITTETPDGWTITHWLHENGLSVSFQIGDQCDSDDEFSFDGYIKWDGCINWSTSTACMAHACDSSEIDKLKRAFEALEIIAAERIAGYCG